MQHQRGARMMKRWKWITMLGIIVITLCISIFLLVRDIRAHPRFPEGMENLLERKAVQNEGELSPQSTNVYASERSLHDIIGGRSKEDVLKNGKLVVDISEHTLTFMVGDEVLKTYNVALGSRTAEDDKKVRGDKRTPRGEFYICQKYDKDMDEYLGTRWMRLSYPSVEDAERGLKEGIITKKEYEEILQAQKRKDIPPQRTALGGGIGIHGGIDMKNKSMGTQGCIGMSNKDVEEIYEFVQIGTPVFIQE